MNILLAAILACNLLFLVGFGLFALKLRKVYRDVKAFITPIDEKTPSELAQTADALSSILARSLVAQIKATFLGKQSGAVRAENAVAGDIAMDSLSSANPLIGGLLKSFPSLAKTLKRNPELLDLAISKLFGNKAQPTNGNHEIAEQVKFKL